MSATISKVRGVHIDGGYREFIAVPESDCYLLPDSLSDEDAVMIEPTTIAIQSCTRAQLEKDDMLLILGAGALGSTILKIARQLCDHIIVADIVDDKLEEAKKNGAKYTVNVLKEDLEARVKEYTEGHGSTVSIDASGTKDSLLTLLKVTGNAGRVMTMVSPPPRWRRTSSSSHPRSWMCAVPDFRIRCLERPSR